MKEACKILGGIILVLGTIGTLVLAVAGGKSASVDYNMYSEVVVEYHRNWALTIGYLFGGGLSTAFSSIVFFALAEILDDLASVKYLQKTMMENIHSIQADDSNTASTLHSSGGWTCPECNRKNRSFESSCICGYYKG